MQRILLTFLCVLLGASVFAQNGTIRGTVTDGETGEAMIGATVVIKGTTNGAATDIDGKYAISVAAGTYTIQVSYVSFQTKEVKDIEVKAGQVVVQNVKLGTDAKALDVVVVTAKVERKAEVALLTMQKKSALVQDGISAQAISRAGDSNAAGAIKRVTGVSVEGGKYVYVRGLGDRYTKTTLNGADIPGLDPNRNTVQMDLFPSNLIDNMVILKTFSPDLPGNFTGGYININTKDFPDRFTFQASASLGFNDQATFNSNFLTYNGGGIDFLGFDDGSRSLPVSRDDRNPDVNNFSRDYQVQTKSPFLNQSYSVSVGNQISLGTKKFGYIAGLSYRKTNQFFESGRLGRFSLAGFVQDLDDLNPNYNVVNKEANETVLWGALLNLSLKLNDRNKIGLNLMHNQNGVTETRTQSGFLDQDPANTFNSFALDFQSRSLSTAQLKGEHAFGSSKEKKPISLDWISAATISLASQPDLRFFGYDVQPDGTVFIATNRNQQRFFRNLEQLNIDNKINLTVPFKINGNDSRFKTGAAFTLKNRDFKQTIFDYGTSGTNRFGQVGPDGTFDPAVYFNSPDLGINNTTQFRDSYTGTESIIGAYVMGDLKLTSKFRVLIGARFEKTDIEVASDDPLLTKGILDNADILPALNITYELKKDMNLRLAYGRTLARPVFRELAPYASYNAVGGIVEVGNPNLKRSLIDNIDLRWEMYPTPGEIVTLSFFYKRIQDPIATAFSIFAPNAEITWLNQEDATVLGAELEVRKRLGFIGLNDFSIGTNITVVTSELNIVEDELNVIRSIDPQRITDLASKGTRPLFAQSPFLINAYLNYANENNGWQASLNFNIFGRRMVVVSQRAVPDVYEKPRPALDFTLKKSLNENWKVSFRARNLLNPDYRQEIDFRSSTSVYDLSNRGRTFSLGVTYLIE
ncbi:hypothetical protein BKI52_31175 [marine bacterium AO1-C]|nr:hypothetical protein BKI52_31175 [marine bacterium AO1-C]